MHRKPHVAYRFWSNSCYHPDGFFGLREDFAYFMNSMPSHTGLNAKLACLSVWKCSLFKYSPALWKGKTCNKGGPELSSTSKPSVSRNHEPSAFRTTETLAFGNSQSGSKSTTSVITLSVCNWQNKSITFLIWSARSPIMILKYL